ncbi:MAG: 2-C-methyl-D-erythritol 4-phosphate cytidylyltransferase [Gemmatimonadota bacterium]
MHSREGSCEPAALVLLAGGTGSRMGGPDKKQFALLAGVPLVLRALQPFVGTPRLAAAVVVVPEEDRGRARALLAGAAPGIELAVVAGGETRQDSVRQGLGAVTGAGTVLIHDAARPLASRELVARVLDAVTGESCVVPVVPVSDTLKRRAKGGVETVSRTGLHAAQTPQGFPLEAIASGHRRAAAEGVRVTDDAALWEREGRPVLLVEGEASNLKLTAPGDWRLAEALLAARERVPVTRIGEANVRQERASRTGIGYDVHRLEPGRRCVLGGVAFDSPVGPAGHSDADVLVHAIMDALLGAAGEADIGQRFPADDPRFAGADSLELLRDLAGELRERFEIVFVDTVLIAETPRVAAHVPMMRQRIAGALGVGLGRVNVKATTAEGLGAIGRAEGVAAHAVATLLARA